MTLLMLALLLCAVALDQGDFVSTDGNHFLSLRPTKSDTEGTAWYVRKARNGDLFACTGDYRFDHGAGPIPAVRLSLAREWFLKSSKSDESRWEFNLNYFVRSNAGRGVYVEYDTTSKGYDLSVIRRIGGDLTGDSGPKQEFWLLHDHLKVGSVISFQEGRMPELRKFPPGYVERAEWKNRIKESPTTIHNTAVLESDWYGWSTDGRRYIAVSLTAGEKWDKGDAWLLVARPQFNAEWDCLVARGTFSIDFANGYDALLIDLPMTRHYAARFGASKAAWSAYDTAERPTGLHLYVPLADRRLQDDDLTLHVGKTYFVNEKGKGERRYNNNGGLFRSASEKLPGSAAGLEFGDTFTVRAGRMYAQDIASWKKEKAILSGLIASPPPGFQLRSRKEVRIVAKPVVEASHAILGNLADVKEYADFQFSNGNYEDCARTMSDVITAGGGDANAYELRGRCRVLQAQFELAVSDYTMALGKQPTADRHYRRGSALSQLRKYQTALEDYKQANKLDPTRVDVFNAAAWLWATCSDASVRDGRRAVMAAKKACELTGWKDAWYFDTLAAAYAEVGDFAMAVNYQTDAVKVLKGRELAEGEARLDLYRRKQPYRQP